MTTDPLLIESDGPVTVARLNRPDKRNAVNDALLDAIAMLFADPPGDTQAIVLASTGPHFSAGLDLSEHQVREPFQVFRHSRHWHEVLDQIQFGGLPVIATLQGAVLGGGLEIALAAHIRVAGPTAVYQMPEGERGIFPGGGAAVRLARVIGADRMTEMMLSGRRLDAEAGQERGLSHYLVDDPEAEAMRLAKQVTGNAPVSNAMILEGLARISGMAREDGLFTESLATALTQSSPEAAARIEAFLSRKK